MIDPTLMTALTLALEKAANTALKYDPATRLRVSLLSGQSLAITLNEFDTTAFLVIDDDCIRFTSWQDEPTTQLKGSLLGLVQLVASDSTSISNAGVELSGDPKLLLELKSIAGDLEIDWEEIISEATGDVAGRQIAQQIRKQVEWAKDRASSGRRLVSEFLTEELRAVPAAVELTHFSDNVDDLRLAVDRLEARCQRLVDARLPKSS